MARRTSSQSVSLFPFLAVLVCTMGALILLLLVTTRRIRQEQERYTAAVEVLDVLESGSLGNTSLTDARAFVVDAEQSSLDAEQSNDLVPAFSRDLLPQNDDSADQLNDLQNQIASASRSREQLQQEVSHLKQQISDQQSQLFEVKNEIETTELQLLTAGKKQRQLEAVSQEMKRLKSEEADLEMQLDQKRRSLEGVIAELEENSAFTEDAESVLAKRESDLIQLRQLVDASSENLTAGGATTEIQFTNSDGTARVPIMINIDESGFTLEPSGIVIRSNDVKGFTTHNNPLIAAVRSIAKYRSAPGATDRPYVLLLVRPSGSLGFYQAQQIMSDAHIHYGYELLETGRTVAAGSVDEEERKVARQSILESLNQRSSLHGALLAAQGRSTQGSTDDQSFGSPSGRQPTLDSGPVGRNGKTIRDMLDLQRRYAGGERKPNSGEMQFADNGQQSNPWATPHSDNSSEAERDMAALTPDARSGQAPGAGNSDAMPGSELERPLQLSGNLGLKGQSSNSNMPNPSDAGGQSDPVATADHPTNRQNSPEIDWPSIEAAPQVQGTRPVDPELLSGTRNSHSPSHPSSLSEQAASGQLASGQQPSAEFADAPPWTPLDPYSEEENIADSRAQSLRSEVTNSQLTNSQEGSQASSNNGWPSQPFANPSVQSLTNSASPSIPRQSAGAGGGSNAASVAQSQPASSPTPEDPALSHLQRFLDEVERDRQGQAPNPVLLRLLRRAESSPSDQLPGNMASPDQFDPAPPFTDEQNHSVSREKPAAPVTPAPARPAPATPAPATPAQSKTNTQNPSAVYYVVRIYVSDEQLIVGPFEAIDIQGWSDQQVAEAAKMGVSETMTHVWAEVRKDALPAVRFLVAPGAEVRCQMTKGLLNRQKIATRAIQKEGVDLSLDQFFSDDLPPTTQTPAAALPSGSSTVQPAIPESNQRRGRSI